MHEYKVEVVRDGRWWMIHVPEIGQLTQTRRLTEVMDMASSLIHISTDIPLSDITVNILGIIVGDHDVLSDAAYVRQARSAALGAEKEAIAALGGYVRQLTKAEIPVRDIAALVDVSPQRVSQLANEKSGR
jgi:hypothetical protein